MIPNKDIPKNASIVEVNGGGDPPDTGNDGIGQTAASILAAVIIVILIIVIPLVACACCRPMTKRQRKRSKSRAASRSFAARSFSAEQDDQSEVLLDSDI